MASAGSEVTLAAPHQTGAFAAVFPLALRIASLASIGVLAWAVVLHLLSSLGIDTAYVLDVRIDDESTPAGSHYIHPSRLFPPVYRLALASLLWTCLGLSTYTVLGRAGDGAVGRLLPPVFLVAAIVALVAPWDRLWRRERFMVLRSLKRILFDGLFASVPFCDVILADILTSYAKVLGDLWVTVGYILNADTRESWGGQWGVPFITALPYIFRLRQCLAEAIVTPSSGSKSGLISPGGATVSTRPTDVRKRHLLNALKYATAFPVIVLSALQGADADLFHGDGDGARRTDLLVYIWIAAVLVNSLYSFWWDVTNDWGLALLLPSAWKQLTRPDPPTRQMTPSPSPTHIRSRSKRSSRLRPSLSASSKGLDVDLGADNGHRPGTPSHHHHRQSTVALLRPSLLVAEPPFYFLIVGVDLLLRLTWSLKLSSHLHAIHELEQGVFLLEALEVARRSMWLLFRIEWEAVRRNIRPEDLVATDDLILEDHYRDDEPDIKSDLPLFAGEPEKSRQWEPLAMR